MRFLKRLDEWLIAVLLAAMTLLTFAQVVMRYVFNSGFTWAQELTSILFAFMIFIGISYGVRVGAHIGVDALIKLFTPRVRRIVSIVAVLFCMVYAGMVIYGSFQYVMKMRKIGIELEDLPVQIWVVRAILPIGFTLLVLRFLPILYNLIRGKSDHLHLANEVADAMKLKQEEKA